MRRGRVACSGAIHSCTEHAGGVQLTDGRVFAETEVVWLPPAEPRTIFAVGLNYADHAREIAAARPAEPLVFLKGHGSLAGHRAATRRPAGVTFMHYECELAVVIGRPGRDISRAAALTHVAGYTVANDYAIRDYLENYYRPNLRVKNRDACTLLGPWLVDADDVPDPQTLRLRTSVNGKVTQEGSTRDMIFSVAQLIEYLSSFMTLGAGDVILTGTPQGVVNVNAGDEVATQIDGIGRLVNFLVDDAAFGIAPAAG
jgi:5-oxopent-3-ene-1,2,5-tricarboxylate decarboxylase/2-hydroxyhepta-2,4-diene-1,7-dioate isomerase